MEAPQYAYRSGYQAHEVVFTLRRLIEISDEWNLSTCILDGDISKAFDETSLGVVYQGLLAKGVHQVIAAAWVREYGRMSTQLTFGSECKL